MGADGHRHAGGHADVFARLSVGCHRRVRPPHGARRDRQQGRVGTEIIEELGEEHQRTGKWIVYTSADSVFQIAAHEETIPLDELYEASGIAREILTGKDAVGRVIARPFVGEPGSYTRTPNRHDWSLKPRQPNYLTLVREAGNEVPTSQSHKHLAMAMAFFPSNNI